ncbi:Biotin synthase [Buchnera aphidicola (Eriosoma lanigerum)]|uniref:biotin synthase BioB n=1 Tax=Buchnera aphidicola TaxID=9 RepID=UPI0034647725
MKKNWNYDEAMNLIQTPFFELMFKAQTIHRQNFDPQSIQISTLLSIKTGSCPEDCKYCPQSARYKTGITIEPLLKIEKILNSAKQAKLSGSSRFCMGAAWKNPKDKDMPYLKKIIQEVKKLGMETCMTLGMLTKQQANILSEAGLDFYNHNLDTSAEFYKNIVTTRTYQDRIDTLNIVRKSGMKICSGGIIGLGETVQDRMKLLTQLANLEKPPESIPINMLMKIKGTPLNNINEVDPFEFIKIIAVTRIMMPYSYIRLSAGREKMNQQTQALCFMAGANSIFYGCKLLTASNPKETQDLKLFEKLNLYPESKKNMKENTDTQSIISHHIDSLNNKYYYNAAQ